MPEKSIFDSLVNNLSETERADLLSKINTNYSQSDVPLEDEEVSEEFDLELSYAQLGFFQRLLVIILSLINNKPRKDIFLQMLLDRIAKKIDKKHPGLLIHSEKQVGPGLYRQLVELRDSIKPVSDLLRFALIEERKSFVAFLAGLEMEEIQNRLRDLNIWAIVDESPQAGEHEIRRLLDNRVGEIFESIDPARKEELYGQWKILESFYQIISYPFQLLLNQFTVVQEGQNAFGSYGSVRKSLREFCDTLSSFSIPPDPLVLEGLILFYSQENIEDKGALEGRIQEYSRKTAEAVDALRQFKATVPLTEIVRICSRDLAYRPEFRLKGEDWFSLFKRFWTGQMDERYRVFLQERKKDKLYQAALELLPEKRMLALDHYSSERSWGGVSPVYGLSLNFLYSYLQTVFNVRIIKMLKILLIDGDFYKPQNKEELSTAYKRLVLLSEEIVKLDAALSGEGDSGKDLAAVEAEMIAARLRQKKISALLRRADGEAVILLRKAADSFNLVGAVLGGVLFGENGGRYDTLSNLGNIGGKNNRNFLISLGNLQSELEKLGHILSDLINLEKRERE